MSDADAQRIRAALDDAHGLCDALGLLDGRFGRDWLRQPTGVTVRCPWHEEKTPSCSVTRGRDGAVRAFCFGCKASGDGLGLIAAAQRLDVRADFAEVLDLAADLAGVARPERRRWEDRPSVMRAIVRRPVEELERPADDGIIDRVAEVLARVAPVTRDPDAMAYLHARGLDDGEARGWYALPAHATRTPVVASILEAVGYDAWMNSGLASMTGRHLGTWAWSWRGPRLVIPWRGPNGAVEALQGRYAGACPEGTSKYVFPGGRAPRWPFGVEALADVGADTALAVCEGAIDAVSFTSLARAHGVDAVGVGLPGVATWDAKWLRLFARRPAIVALDNDEGGDRHVAVMVERLRVVARRGGLTTSRPVGAKDWNDALVASRRAA